MCVYVVTKIWSLSYTKDKECSSGRPFRFRATEDIAIRWAKARNPGQEFSLSEIDDPTQTMSESDVESVEKVHKDIAAQLVMMKIEPRVYPEPKITIYRK